MSEYNLISEANESVVFSAEIAQVIAPYTATGLEQLTLAPGQLILIRKKNPGGWWEGELQVWKSINTHTHTTSLYL